MRTDVACESCGYCQIRYVKSIEDNTYRCRLQKMKPCVPEDDSGNYVSVLVAAPDWCPLKKEAAQTGEGGQNE